MNSCFFVCSFVLLFCLEGSFVGFDLQVANTPIPIHVTTVVGIVLVAFVAVHRPSPLSANGREEQRQGRGDVATKRTRRTNQPTNKRADVPTKALLLRITLPFIDAETVVLVPYLVLGFRVVRLCSVGRCIVAVVDAVTAVSADSGSRGDDDDGG